MSLYSPLKDEKFKNNKIEGIALDFSDTDLQEIQDNSYRKNRDSLLCSFKYDDILSIGMWNPNGATKKNYAELRVKMCQDLIKLHHLDLLLIQEPRSCVELSYLKDFKVTTVDYDVILSHRNKADKEVAIVYNRSRLEIVESVDCYAEILKLNQSGTLQTSFKNLGQKRVQAVRFKVLKQDHDGNDYYNSNQQQNEILVVNFHSVYNNFSVETKVNFITEFFQLVQHLQDKFNGIPVFIGGDFNIDINKHKLDEILYQNHGISLVFNLVEEIDPSEFKPQNHDSSIPRLQGGSDENLLEENVPVKNSIDYFCILDGVADNSSVRCVNCQRLPIRYKSYMYGTDSLKYSNIKQLEYSRTSTHDPIFSFLVFKTNGINIINDGLKHLKC
eukprot:gene9036-11068_t